MGLKTKDKAIILLNKIINCQLSEYDEKLAINELDKILIDPKWSDYIFWSDDYILPDGNIDYDKFFKKIEEYPSSEEYKRNQYIISLVNNLLTKNFQQKSEMEIVNELNHILSTTDWIDYLFVSKICLNEDGSLDEKSFLDMVFLIKIIF